METEHSCLRLPRALVHSHRLSIHAYDYRVQWNCLDGALPRWRAGQNPTVLNDASWRSCKSTRSNAQRTSRWTSSTTIVLTMNTLALRLASSTRTEARGQAKLALPQGAQLSLLVRPRHTHQSQGPLSPHSCYHWRQVRDPPQRFSPNENFGVTWLRHETLYVFRRSVRRLFPQRCPEQDDLRKAQNYRRIFIRMAGCGLGSPRKRPKHFFVGLSSRLVFLPYQGGGGPRVSTASTAFFQNKKNTCLTAAFTAERCPYLGGVFC